MGPDALFWSGIALARARHFGEAAPILEQFLAAFPGSPHGAEARMTLGDAQLALGQKDAARASYERAAQSSRADVRARAEAALGALR
jgi:TolA-binding protein